MLEFVAQGAQIMGRVPPDHDDFGANGNELSMKWRRGKM
jgi:hypothetical protein